MSRVVSPARVRNDVERGMREIFVVSSWAPPTIGGTPTVLRNLLDAVADLGGPSVRVLRQHVSPEEPWNPRWATTTLSRPFPFKDVRGGHYVLAPAVFALVLRRIRRRPDARLVLTLPEESFALAAALACRFAGRPYALYMHNTYAEQMTHPLDKLLARAAERWLITGASPLLVLSTALRDLYLEKYGVPGIVVPHIARPSEYASLAAAALPRGLEPRSYALFTGDVYGMNLDSLQRLQRVLRRSFDRRLTFAVSGQKNARELRALGLHPDLVLTGADRQTVLALQKFAAVLLAPLAFDSPFPDEVRTALPTKVIEYLGAGSPILVHAPSESLLAGLAGREGWAEVVTTPSERALTHALERVLSDTSSVAAMERRRVKALQRHSAEAVAKTFVESLERQAV